MILFACVRHEQDEIERGVRAFVWERRRRGGRYCLPELNEIFEQLADDVLTLRSVGGRRKKRDELDWYLDDAQLAER